MRILLLAANFAPRSGSHPTRTVHFAKYMNLLGHEVKVITYEERQLTLFSEGDESLTAKIPAEVEVIRVGSGWLHRILDRVKQRGRATKSIKSRATRNPAVAFLIPDPHISAKRNFVKASMRIARSWQPDVLVTCAYPFTMTLVGSEVKRAFPGLVWIADYGDPWTGAPVAELKLPRWRRVLDRWLESRCLARADAVTVTTEPTAAMYRLQFPKLADRTHVLTMGYDPDDDSGIVAANRTGEDADKVILLHAGRLYSEARDSGPFIAALETCFASDPVLFSRLKIVLLGEVEAKIADAIARSSAAELYQLEGWVTVDESLARMKGADGLLLFGNQGAMQIPGKIFQYFGTGRPVFMIFESEEDPTVDAVRRYGRAILVQNAEASLAAALRDFVTGGGQLTNIETDCLQFSWPSIVKKLLEIATTSGAATTRGA